MAAMTSSAPKGTTRSFGRLKRGGTDCFRNVWKLTAYAQISCPSRPLLSRMGRSVAALSSSTSQVAEALTSAQPMCHHLHHSAASENHPPGNTLSDSSPGKLRSMVYHRLPRATKYIPSALALGVNSVSSFARMEKSTQVRQISLHDAASVMDRTCSSSWSKRCGLHRASCSSLRREGESRSSSTRSVTTCGRWCISLNFTCLHTCTLTSASISDLYRNRSSFTIFSLCPCISILSCATFAEIADTRVEKISRPPRRHQILNTLSELFTGNTCMDPGVICVNDQCNAVRY
mmetsp:Transcript_62181/g.176676  ORF Transcript_62181/g.176676 Transcript_62181/m.176676 type:complete len:290 (+) Transcript_62181:689-1558(+)